MNPTLPKPQPHRVGLLIPSSNSTVEFEYNRFGPRLISWHTGRLTLTEVTPAAIAAQEPEIEQEASKLGTVYPALTILCQSAIGFLVGEAHESALLARIAAATGTPALSAAALMVAALRGLGAHRIALATPFQPGVDAAVSAYFKRAGFELGRRAALGRSGNFALAGIGAAEVIDMVRSVDAPDIDVVVLPGGNLRAVGLIPEVEAAIRKPVLLTNQACIWATAGIVGVEAGASLGHLAATDPDRTIRAALLNVGGTPA